MTDAPKTPTDEALMGVQQALMHGAFAEARRAAERLAADFPDHPRVANLLGLALMQTGAPDPALAAFARATDADPGYASAHVNRANLLVALGRFAEAIPVSRAALAATPDPANTAKASFLLGVAQLKTGAPEAALAPLRAAIAADPSMVGAHVALGGLLGQLGRQDQAVAVLEPAFRRWPENAEIGRNLATALSQLGRFAEAAAVLDPLAAKSPGDVELCLALAQVWRNAGRSDRALAAAEAAVAAAPDRTEALGLVGSCKRDLGDIDGAVAAYDRVLELAPDDPIALVARWRVSPAPETLVSPARVAALLDDPSLSQGHRGALELLLFDIEDKAGRPEVAAGHLARALQARRADRPYDIARQAQMFDAIRAAFSGPAPVSGGEIGAPAPRRVVFIVGMPRSGTSLVEQILASHGAVFGGGELPHLGRAMAAAGWGSGKIGHPPTPDMLADLRSRYHAGLAELETDRAVITDKTPMNFRWLGFALAAMPEARALVLQRDARATCYSNLTHQFSGRANDFGADMLDTAEMYRLHLGLVDLWRARFPDRVALVPYERLTEDQEAESRALVAAAGLDWDPACLAFHDTARRVRTASAEQVRKPMYTGSSEAWRRYASFLEPMLARLEGL